MKEIVIILCFLFISCGSDSNKRTIVDKMPLVCDATGKGLCIYYVRYKYDYTFIGNTFDYDIGDTIVTVSNTSVIKPRLTRSDSISKAEYPNQGWINCGNGVYYSMDSTYVGP